MNATIADTITENTAGSALSRAVRRLAAFLRNAIKQYGAPYLNGPLPPL
ncbi:hypothetical protein [Pseudoduganella lutea]|nr:hypothetical protein [Pseudoduganella lutea]